MVASFAGYMSEVRQWIASAGTDEAGHKIALDMTNIEMAGLADVLGVPVDGGHHAMAWKVVRTIRS